MTIKGIKKRISKYQNKMQQSLYERKKKNTVKKLKGFNATIISNNCWAGRAYQYLDLPYLSPTIGLYFFADDYLKFVSNLKYYLSKDLSFISPKQSRYFSELKERNQLNIPIGKIDDVEIMFLHYKTKEEAYEKWNRRKNRVNYDKLIFKFSNMNGCTEEIEEKFMNLPLENKFFINNIKRNKYKNEYQYKDKENNTSLTNDTIPFPGSIPLEKALKI